jgi:hypothetical protein
MAGGHHDNRNKDNDQSGIQQMDRTAVDIETYSHTRFDKTPEDSKYRENPVCCNFKRRP